MRPIVRWCAQGVELGVDDEHMLALCCVSKEAAAVALKVQAMVGTSTRTKRATLAQCDELLQKVESIPLRIEVRWRARLWV